MEADCEWLWFLSKADHDRTDDSGQRHGAIDCNPTGDERIGVNDICAIVLYNHNRTLFLYFRTILCHLVKVIVFSMPAKSLHFPHLQTAVQNASLRVVGHQAINDLAHARCVTALLTRYGNSSRGFLYIEPPIPASDLAPDIVLAHPDLGVLVVEVKAYEVSFIVGAEAGHLKIKRQGSEVQVNPLRQAQKSMYAIKQAWEQYAAPDSRLLWNALVALPNINEAAWLASGYEAALSRHHILFADDMNDPARLQRRLAQMIHQTLALSGLAQPLPPGSEELLQRVFGQPAQLSALARPARHLPFENLGAEIDRLEQTQHKLSPEQQHLIKTEVWGHPFLLRGVAGSGKTIVLAYQAATAILRQEQQAMQLNLFPQEARPFPKIAALSLHRTLAPLLHSHIEAAYHALTGHSLPPQRITVTHLNGLLFQLAEQHPYFHYLPMTAKTDTGERSRQFLAQLDRLSAAELEALRFDAFFLDEGQDLHPDTLALVQALLRPDPSTKERTLAIYYDDAQNIYGHQRPTWRDLGLNVEGGRAALMQQCYRNSQEIAELAWNVLLGSAADEKTRVQTRRFADSYTLSEKGLVSEGPEGWRVHFAQPSGIAPQVQVYPTRAEQAESVAQTVQTLLQKENLRPQDMLILTNSAASMTLLEQRLAASLDGLTFHLVGGRYQAGLDVPLLAADQLTLSTIAAAKGYDAPLVILMDADQLPLSLTGRASFYVGATRAKRYLIVTGIKTRESLLSEAVTVHKRLFG
jgi:hypothetical protein